MKYKITLILILATVLRLYKLGEIPALNADEAAIGYNAYSIINTGKDEHGNWLPIHFQSFNDYKPGLYFYLVMPFIKILGLNEISVRLPSVFMGVGTVLIIYYIVNELVKEKKFAFREAPIFASLFLAISPWHIHYSRGAWEVNAATFFITAATLFLIKGFKKKKLNNIFIYLSIILFSLAVYSYHAARIIAPFLFVYFCLVNIKSIVKTPQFIIKPLLFGAILSLPLIFSFLRGDIFSRSSGVSLLADPGAILRANEQRGEHSNSDFQIGRILHNKFVNTGLIFANNWMEHYSGDFLFITGDTIQRNRIPQIGELYLFSLLLIIPGIFQMLKNVNMFRLVIFWLLVAPVPAALTFQSPHALRSQNMIIPLTVITAVGLSVTSEWFRNKNPKIYFAFSYVFLATILFNLFGYLHNYYKHMPKEYPFSSQYGVKELSAYLIAEHSKYNKIIITDKYDQPYILLLFYLIYPPKQFQNNHVITSRDLYGFSTVTEFDKFMFKRIDWDNDKLVYPGSLIIGTDMEIPNEANIVKNIYGSNGYLYFQAVAN